MKHNIIERGEKRKMERKAVSRIMLTLLLLSMLTLAFNIQPVKAVKAEPKTWYVDDSGGKDFTRIQDAIYAASPGDTIYVYNGTYYEHIYIDKSLTLIGENKYGAIIDGSGYGPIVTIYGFNVTFAHFTVRNAGWTNWERDNGIRLYQTQSSQVTDCIVSGGAYGIREMGAFYPQGRNVIKGNTVSDCTEIAIGSSHASSIGNIVANNTIKNSTNGIYFNNPYNMQIVGNHIFGTESQHSQYGIHLQVGGLSNTIIGNRIEYSDNAIRLDYADKNVVTGNIVSDNTFAIFVGYESSDNIVTRNNASYSAIGILVLDQSHNNTITKNDVSNNYYGIALFSSDNSKIYHNNFIDNTQQVLLSDSFNTVWDNGYPSGGNYWSNYADVDLFSGPNQDMTGSDGIWDHPYVIDASNKDNYPLFEPWEIISATVDVYPKTLNVYSLFGQSIKVYIELPVGYSVSDINISTVKLNDEVPAESHSINIGDYDKDGIPDLMVKFDRMSVVKSIFRRGESTLTITGIISGPFFWKSFEGSDTIKVLGLY